MNLYFCYNKMLVCTSTKYLDGGIYFGEIKLRATDY